MTAQDVCPGCGAGKRTKWGLGVEFSCGSHIAVPDHSFNETGECLRLQRNKLRRSLVFAELERDRALGLVRELEAQLHAEQIKSAAASFDVEETR